jgi:hypothetical protein
LGTGGPSLEPPDRLGNDGEPAITNTGKSIAVFGEGISYDRPGGVWINGQL